MQRSGGVDERYSEEDLYPGASWAQVRAAGELVRPSARTVWVQVRVVAERPNWRLVAIEVDKAHRRIVRPPSERVLVVGDRDDLVLLITTSSPSRHDYLLTGWLHGRTRPGEDAGAVHAFLSTDTIRQEGWRVGSGTPPSRAAATLEPLRGGCGAGADSAAY